MNKKRYINLIPLTIVIITVIYLLFSVWKRHIVLQQPHKPGLAVLGIVILLQIINEKAGYYSTLFMLTLGVVSSIAFTPSIFTFEIGVIKVDMFCSLVLFVYLIIHRSLVADLFRAQSSKSNQATGQSSLEEEH